MLDTFQHHVHTGVMTTRFYVDDVPAQEQGVPACGHGPSEWYPSGCTRAAGHGGRHGYPNWSGHLEAEPNTISGGVTLRISHSHGPSTLDVRNREQADALLAFLAGEFEVAFSPQHAQA